MAFAGGQDFIIGGVRYRSANITPDASGIAHYNEALFIQTMRTGNVGGAAPRPDHAAGRTIGKLTDADLEGAVGVPEDRARRSRTTSSARRST